jgi:hypothetical protein
VEHACYKCGATVEEGAPFCPACRAPQIRVNIPSAEEREFDRDAPATPPFPPGTPGELQPPARPVALPSKVRFRDALGPAIAATILMIVALALTVRVPAALIPISTGAGALSVYFYSRRWPARPLTARNGARLGMISGVFSFVIFTLGILYVYFVDRGVTFRQVIEQLLKAQPNNPNAVQMLNELGSPEFMATFVVAMIAFMAVILIGFSSIGGAIAASLLRRKQIR